MTACGDEAAWGAGRAPRQSYLVTNFPLLASRALPFTQNPVAAIKTELAWLPAHRSMSGLQLCPHNSVEIVQWAQSLDPHFAA